MANITKRKSKSGKLSFLIKVSLGYDIDNKQIVKETLIKSFAHIVQSDFLSVCSKNRRNTGVLRGFFGHTGGKYANKMCK